MTQTNTRGGFKSRAMSFVSDHLPTRTKRLIVLASLGGRLKGTKSMDTEMMSKLNSLMVLGNSDASLKLPVFLSSAIWDGKVQAVEKLESEVQRPTTIQNIAKTYTAQVPAWLRYGEDRVIRDDIEKLLGTFGTVVFQPA